MHIKQYDSYEDYKEHQVAINVEKLSAKKFKPWVNRDDVASVAYFQQGMKSVLCHGVRDGTELTYFKHFLPDAEVIGTDISDTVLEYGGVVHDMQEPKEEWVGKFDIVYTNSFDHVLDPEKTLNTFADQLTPNGFIAMEVVINDWDEGASDASAFESHEEFREFVDKLGFKVVMFRQGYKKPKVKYYYLKK